MHAFLSQSGKAAIDRLPEVGGRTDIHTVLHASLGSYAIGL